jgi:serine/threonine protein kinase
MIGEGAFGKVFKGYDEENNRFIAIKEYNYKSFNENNIDVLFFFKY